MYIHTIDEMGTHSFRKASSLSISSLLFVICQVKQSNASKSVFQAVLNTYFAYSTPFQPWLLIIAQCLIATCAYGNNNYKTYCVSVHYDLLRGVISPVVHISMYITSQNMVSFRQNLNKQTDLK